MDRGSVLEPETHHLCYCFTTGKYALPTAEDIAFYIEEYPDLTVRLLAQVRF